METQAKLQKDNILNSRSIQLRSTLHYPKIELIDAQALGQNSQQLKQKHFEVNDF